MESRIDLKRTNTEPEEERQVALLISDLEMAKTISSVFRKVGVVPYVYTTLKEFWKGVIEDRPDFSIADVKLSSEGTLLLKDHPLIKTKEIQLSFFWEKETAPLLVSTFDIFHHGLICRELPLTGQIKSILKRFNEWSELKKNAVSEHTKKENLDNKITQVVRVSETLKEKAFYHKLLRSIIARFENRKDENHFDLAVAGVLSSINEISEFTIFELSKSGQKLITSSLDYDKFVKVPPLWLGKTCESGIEFFAQNMASQVCIDLMGGDLMSLNIQGLQDAPEKLIILKVKNEEILQDFEWDVLENYLSGFYCSMKWRTQMSLVKTESQYLAPWQLYSLLDEGINGRISADGERLGSDKFVLIDICFDSMLFEINSRKLRFYWNEFITDFFAGVNRQKSIDFKLSFFGVSNAACLVESDLAEEFFDFMKAYISRYSFWRYFDDAELILGKSLKPEIKMIPSSIDAYSTYLTSKNIIEEEMPVADKFFAPGSAPEQTM